MQGVHRVGDAALGEDDVGGLHGDIRARADGHAHVRPHEGRRVVDAVAHHGHLFAIGHELPDFGLFFIG